ncbi:amidase [Nonomuraea sp. NPDC059194]|uniref:amidase n=1 Tax=Nonomuraea sp. NPDC059194 TaxID=3346764 RepID=UPI0036A10146
MDEVLRLDAVGQAQAVREGRVAPRELVEAAIAKIRAHDDELNAIVHPRFERALAELDDLPEGAPFRGVPILVKDLGWAQAGEPYNAGSATLDGVEVAADAHAVTRLCEAGFVILGRTSTPEFGTTITTEPAAYGPTRNPYDLAYSAGGSSGGSAAAVAAGLVAVATASDGGGSIRIPAGQCGLVGLKPTKGRSSQGPAQGEGGELARGARRGGVRRPLRGDRGRQRGAELESIGRWRGKPVELSELEPRNRAMAEAGRRRGAVDHILALQWIDGYRRRMASWWSGHDVLLTPTLGVPPYPLGWLPPGDLSTSFGRTGPAVAFTSPFNATGQPAISLPLYRTAEGLPVGVQLVAAAGREDLLVRLAAQIERAHPFEHSALR